MSQISADSLQNAIHGARATIPMIVGAIPFGILFGALGVGNGLSGWATLSMSLFVFAGSSQFVAVTLIGQGTGIGIIIITTFIVNIRHALYAASLGRYIKKETPQSTLAPMAFILTDETFATVVHHYDQQPANIRLAFYFGSGLAMYLNWQVCTLLGIILGQQLESATDWGLEFAMVATFLGIIIPRLNHSPALLGALVSATCAVYWQDLSNNIGLAMAAIAGITSAVICEAWQKRGNNND